MDLHVPTSNCKKSQPKTNISRQKKVYLSKSEPKEGINSVKDNSIKVDSTLPGVKYYGDNIYGEYQMLNPHQQSQYENNSYISFGRYQHKWNGTDDFDRGYSCGHGVNHFGYYGNNLCQYGLNGIYSPIGYSGDQCSNFIRYAGDCNRFNERSRLNRCGDQNQRFEDSHATWLFYLVTL